MSEAPTLNDDFLDMLDALQSASVDFLIVGAHAMAVHGVPRATGDLDILVRPDPANAKRVTAALHQFGAPSHSTTSASVTSKCRVRFIRSVYCHGASIC